MWNIVNILSGWVAFENAFFLSAQQMILELVSCLHEITFWVWEKVLKNFISLKALQIHPAAAYFPGEIIDIATDLKFLHKHWVCFGLGTFPMLLGPDIDAMCSASPVWGHQSTLLRFTMILPGLEGVSCNERLARLGLFSPECRGRGVKRFREVYTNMRDIDIDRGWLHFLKL